MGEPAERERAKPGKTKPWAGTEPTWAAPSPPEIAPPRLAPGTRVGEYQIVELLGEGGMGMVYAGLQPIIDKRVAIKVLNAALAGDASMVGRFMQEARAITRIDHPNITSGPRSDRERTDAPRVDAGPSRQRLYRPTGVAVHPSGVILIADEGNNRLRALP